MKFHFSVFILLFFSTVFCSSPRNVTTPGDLDRADEDLKSTEGPQNTIIIGEFLGEAIDRTSDVVNSSNRREAFVRVIEVVKAGSDYHGQFTDGDRITVEFDRGWSGDDSKQAVLNKGDQFKAELIELDTRITIYYYEKI